MASEKYQGRAFALLLIAMCGPAVLLFLRLVFDFAAASPGLSPQRSASLLNAAHVSLFLYFAAQLAGAYQMRTMLPARRAWWAQALQFSALLILGVVFSATGALILEAFGYNFFVRIRQ